MAKQQKAVWLIRAGSRSEAEEHFLKRKLLALGPAEVGNVSGVTGREAYKEQFRATFPNATSTSIGGGAGQLFRFVNEAKVNDLIVYPAKKDGIIHLGLIVGAYRFDEAKEERFPHQRKVRWLGIVSRSEMSAAFLNEARAFKSFYRIAKCEQEVMALLARFDKKSVGNDG